MISKNDAIAIAQAYIEKIQDPKNELALLLDSIETKPYGWVFSFNSKKFIETRKLSYCIPGYGPLLVTMEDGQIVAFGTARGGSYELDEWAEENGWQ